MAYVIMSAVQIYSFVPCETATECMRVYGGLQCFLPSPPKSNHLLLVAPPTCPANVIQIHPGLFE